MDTHYLTPLFSPRSVAVFGASDTPDAIGQIVFHNMLEGGYKGRLYAINPKRKQVQGQPCYAGIAEIEAPIDLVVIATPPATVPDIIEACGQHGVKAAVIISAGFAETGPAGQALEREVLDRALHHGIRLIGPNCLGVMRPGIGLNATFNHGNANRGHLAIVSQSGALCTAILDWAKNNDVGFSSVVSLGSSADVDFGEILDYLVTDAETQSVLLYIEGIHDARSFMSAVRAVARVKPVILVKVGRHAAGSRAAMSHTASLAGSDAVFDAVVRRLGVIRVQTISQLFSAARAMSCGFHPGGNRLAVVTNGGGPGVMAADRAADLGIVLAELSEDSLKQLDSVLPPHWSHGNPVDLIGDAGADRYRAAVQICLEDEGVDGVLAILTPQAMTKPLAVAETVIALSNRYTKPLITCWMGEAQVEAARDLLIAAKKPHFRTPEPAVEVFSYLSAYYQNQQLLMQLPGPLSQHEDPDLAGARMVIDEAMLEKRTLLSEMEAKAILSAFDIQVARTVIVHSASEALVMAEQFGFPVAMKVHSPDIPHKSDVGGVVLNIYSAAEVRSAFMRITENIRVRRPDARLAGIAIEPMIRKPNGRELIVGVSRDPVFGPVITFGAGGVLVEVLSDTAVALPPLNSFLARDMIDRTRVSKMLGAFRGMPPADLLALETVLLRVSEMVCELPMLMEMDINPLILDEHGAVAVDARMVIAQQPVTNARYGHMAIYPYPTHLISHYQLLDGTNILIRPTRPEDAELVQKFVHNLSEESRYFRFMTTINELSTRMLVQFTQIDYSREMALVAVKQEDAQEVEIGVSRYIINPDAESCEFALVVADAMQGKGLGRQLMLTLMDAAREHGLKRMEGVVLKNNTNMLRLMADLGFKSRTSDDDDSLKVVSRAL